MTESRSLGHCCRKDLPMKRGITLLLSCCALIGWMAACAAPSASISDPTSTPAPTRTPSPVEAVSKLHWFGISANLYNGSQKIYFDPVLLAGTLPTADIILITHAHDDHWSVPDLKKVIGPNTTLVISPNVTGPYETAKSELDIPAIVLEEGKTTEVNGVSIEAVPAFDIDEVPKGSGAVGYIVTVDGVRIYHAGGTNAHPEMVDYHCNIAILPMYYVNDLLEMVKLVPAQIFVIEHTSYYAAQSAGKLADLAEGQTIADLKEGPFMP